MMGSLLNQTWDDRHVILTVAALTGDAAAFADDLLLMYERYLLRPGSFASAK
jgi:protein subunit release factor A